MNAKQNKMLAGAVAAAALFLSGCAGVDVGYYDGPPFGPYYGDFGPYDDGGFFVGGRDHYHHDHGHFETHHAYGHGFSHSSGGGGFGGGHMGGGHAGGGGHGGGGHGGGGGGSHR